MEKNNKIDLYKVRNFSEVMGASLDFLRHNFKPLSKAVLYIFAPISLVSAFLLTRYIINIFSMASNPQDLGQFNPLYIIFSGGNLLMMIISVVSYLLILSLVFNYFIIYQKKEGEITFKDIWDNLWNGFFSIFGYTIITGIMVVFAFLLLIIPGIYLIAPVTLGMAILIFEKKDIFQSITRAFELIKNHWWETFGLIIVASIFRGIVSNVFSVPFYIGYFYEVIKMGVDKEIPDFSGVGVQIYLTISFFIMLLGSYLTYVIPLVIISFQYFSLAERKEARSLMNEVEQFDINKNQGGGIEV